MAKQKTQFSCQECGYSSAKWLGKCPSCEAWNSFAEELPDLGQNAGSLADVREAFKPSDTLKVSLDRKEWEDLAGEDGTDGKALSTPPRRILTGLSELDRVLGGGLAPDSFTLLGGDPGIGKSTLLLQMAKGLIDQGSELKIFYVSGEESVEQIRGRAHRLGIRGKGKIFLAAETLLERAFASIKEIQPDIVFVDSLQTFSTGANESAPGSVGQVREITARLMTLAKTAGIAVWLVGHITKEGTIAGPKTVEHMVDTVLYFEGESGQTFRMLRAVKNRFGSTRELGVFEMDGEGLREVTNPSSLFLSDRKSSVSGTAVAALLEGSRPLMVELQALVASSGLAMPRRTAVGMDSSRLSLLAAILEKHMKLPLTQHDLFFNVVGGLKLTEPACDLAAVAAVWSSAKDIALPGDWVWVGEVGLTGEIRRVSQTDLRIEEARRLGFKAIVLPEATPRLDTILSRLDSQKDFKVYTLSRIDQLPKLVS